MVGEGLTPPEIRGELPTSSSPPRVEAFLPSPKVPSFPHPHRAVFLYGPDSWGHRHISLPERMEGSLLFMQRLMPHAHRGTPSQCPSPGTQCPPPPAIPASQNRGVVKVWGQQQRNGLNPWQHTSPQSPATHITTIMEIIHLPLLKILQQGQGFLTFQRTLDPFDNVLDTMDE